MKEFLGNLLYDWGGNTPKEVIWACNTLLEYAKKHGFESDIEFEENYPSAIENGSLALKLATYLEKKIEE